jgi:hypothetical protein
LFLAGAMTCLVASPAFAEPVAFSNGNVTNQIAMATRPEIGGNFEIEAADDFVVTNATQFTHATITGLLTGGATIADISQIVAEIYRIFPLDSNTARTPNVPTRVNSPSDVALLGRDSTSGELTFTTSVLSNSFTALNSVQPGGIHGGQAPTPTTGGNGPVTGIEVLIDLVFSTPISLDPDHYFFVPQVGVSNGEFLWLSSVRPIVAPGTPFSPDLQAWTRDQFLDPDWLRVGTDIVGVGTFNAAFTLDGRTIPEPSTLALTTLAALAFVRRRQRPTADVSR